VLAVVLPAVRVREPPPSRSPLPTVKETDPPLPAKTAPAPAAEPDPNAIEPELPDPDVPELKLRSPDCPDVPAFAVLINREPLVDDEPAPLANIT
jgi:hypothetical protein